MSPEQSQGIAGDERSDIYSLGVILYEICTGKPPFQGGVVSLITQKINTAPPSPSLVNPNIQPALASVILRSLAIKPSARYPTVSSLVADLKQALFMPGQGELGPLINPLSPQLSLPPGSPLSPPQPLLPPAVKAKQRKPLFRLLIASLLVILVIALLIPLVGPRLISLFSPTSQIVGEASFLNSGQLNGTNDIGINDELHIDLHNISDPPPGKSYYAWLLEDSNQSDSQAILLAKLTVTQGSVHSTYKDLQHNNLLGQYSRLLITEEDASMVPVGPSPDTSTWKYFAQLPQTPDPKDKNHFSILDHLRHLLAADPDLQAGNLPGGLDIWLYRTTGKVSDIAGTARSDWDNQSTADMRQQLVLLLDYLDGRSLVQRDLPPNTALPTIASFDSIGLLGQQNQLPQGYLAHIDTHLRSIAQAPDVTQPMSQQAIQISNHLNLVRQWLEAVHADALRLLRMDSAQLLSQDAKLTLDDMKTHADYAYNGGLNQEGIRQIYSDIQRLATFEVQPYISQ
jgi:protein tyrosine kinase